LDYFGPFLIQILREVISKFECPSKIASKIGSQEPEKWANP
jgi:hypothetical protein